MSEQFSFLGDKCKAAIAAISLGVLLLLPASLGYGGTIIQEAFGQEPPPSASTFLLRGLIGSILPAQAGDIATENSSSHIVTGRFRVFANESLVNRFVVEMDLAAIEGIAINGTAFRNVTIEDTTPHRFQLTETGNGSATTSAGGSVPPVSSNLMTRIYVDSNTPIVDNVPMTISIRGQVLAIEGIDIDETTITDTGQQDILSIIDGQSIYGIVAR
ncbi:MAG: hypothetical protein K0S84_1556 [Nitrososphaera sp.]|jgi:hypothetical protein|nr:hypothetical protein [Nitrososphaera sp.]